VGLYQFCRSSDPAGQNPPVDRARGAHQGEHEFEIDWSSGVEATEPYPDVKYTTVDEYLNRLL